MKVSILQEQLARGLSIVGRAVDSRSTLPVLSNVLLATGEARLMLAATNLELSVTTYIGAQVQKDGSITLPAKTLGELVSNLSPERVDLNLDPATQTVNVKCGTTNSHIKGIAASEFPRIPEAGNPDIVINGGQLKAMIAQTVFAAAREDTRPILTGIYVHLDKNVITMAAADGFRLGVRTAVLDQTFDKPRELVIPARTLAEVARIISDEERDVAITLPGERDLVQFAIENTVVSSQLIEGRFPDFAAIIPKAYNTLVQVDAADLLKQCKRAEIFARDNNYSARLTIRPPAGPGEPGEVLVTGKSNERGDNEGLLDASVEGAALETAFNVRYLIDVLSVIGDGTVRLESNGPSAPGVLRLAEREDFLHLIMPMSVNR